jgi:hypothetical protein
MQCRLSLEEAEAGVQLLVLAPLPPPVEGRWRQLCLEALSKSFAVKHCRHSEESIYSEEDMGRRQQLTSNLWWVRWRGASASSEVPLRS